MVRMTILTIRWIHQTHKRRRHSPRIGITAVRVLASDQRLLLEAKFLARSDHDLNTLLKGPNGPACPVCAASPESRSLAVYLLPRDPQLGHTLADASIFVPQFPQCTSTLIAVCLTRTMFGSGNQTFINCCPSSSLPFLPLSPLDLSRDSEHT